MAKLLGAGITANRTMTWPDADAHPLTDHDTVRVPQGGTGAVTLPVNGVLYGNDAGAIQALGVNSTATKKFLTQTSSGAPAWSTIAVGDGGTGLTSYAVGDLVYASGAAALSQLAAVAVGQVLVSGGVAAAPAWSASPTLTVLTLAQAALGVVSTNGLVAQNTTAATSGATVQMSPRIGWLGHVWNTAADETSYFFAENLPATAATPTATWKLGYSRNGGAATYPLTITSGGSFGVIGNIAANGGFVTVGIDTGAFIFGGKTLMSGNATDGLMQITKQAQTVGVGLDVATDAVLKIRTRAQTGYATVDALGYSVGGVAGASKAAGAVTSITVVNGIVTAIS